MSYSLSPSAYRLLQGVSKELLKKPCVSRQPSQALTTVLDWSDMHEVALGAARRGDKHVFDQQQLTNINRTLKELGQRLVEDYLSGASSLQQAEQGYNEDKNVSEGPRAQRVLVSLPASVPAWLSVKPRSMHDVDWHEIRLEVCDVLIQVENLGSFYEFSPDIAALSGYVNPLIVYRGDSHYGGGFAQLAEAWRKTQRPHIYAGDFDVKGVMLALDSNATHLLLPGIEWLTQHATPLHVPAEQFPYQRRLRKHLATLPSAHPLRDYLTLLLEKQRGLKQQWFGGEMVCVG
ncbi:hypothetical protein [Halomonas citrativorans]|uniref:DUF7281 domain-containing protein n=1 Tax=Halomonas citrativorans TaxID=2742612 RepID=A0ABR9F9J9_9GAMM|nr:hypothetical protein [Halomonas citrativorans]MBE0403165.1 hypothetical protein [Halomonas citrativorans]